MRARAQEVNATLIEYYLDRGAPEYEQECRAAAAHGGFFSPFVEDDDDDGGEAEAVAAGRGVLPVSGAGAVTANHNDG